MSSLPWNAGDPLFLPAGFQPCPEQSRRDKKAIVLEHIARSQRFTDLRPASRLEVRPKPEMLSVGVPEVDAITGGIPRGCLSEICGPASSGKTSVLLATIASATQREESCVLIDASDSFDPESGSAAGLDFSKLLWVRCGDSHHAHAVSPIARPRSSARKLWADDNRSLVADAPLTRTSKSGEHRLEQVLKTTDLILQSGGFGLVALDLAGIPERFVRRIPLASWFRFQRTVEHTKTALLVITEIPCAQTCASLVVKLALSAIGPQLSEKLCHAQLLERMHVEAEVVRMRMERKPAASVRAVFATLAIRAG
jgi:hypothetical protein